MRPKARTIAAFPCSCASRFAITSAKGGAVMLFDRSGAHIATHRRADLSGVAAQDGGFLASDGGGAIWQVTDNGLSPARTAGPMWDNHLVAIGQA